MTDQELMELLKDPKTAQKAQKILSDDGEKELEEILAGVDITEEDTLDSLSKKHQGQIKKLVGYFNKKIEAAETSAVDKATAPSREAKQREILEFEKKYPKGMKNPEVIAIMQPLYDKGKNIEECYKTACRALELDPESGEPPKEEPEKDAKKKEPEKKGKVTSLKSNLGDETDLEEPEKKEADKPVTMKEALEANMNTLMAKAEDKSIFET